MDLFNALRTGHRDAARPLAARLRPRSLEEFVGQEHFLGEGKLLRRLLQADRLGSVSFYGPPGCGKTALAHKPWWWPPPLSKRRSSLACPSASSP